MLNFEQYFYNDHRNINISAADNSKLVAGLVKCGSEHLTPQYTISYLNLLPNLL